MPTDEQVLQPGTYELEDGKLTLHVWLSGGEMWACSVYDHSAFCRLCQPVTEALGLLLADTLAGKLRCRQDAAGQFMFQVTEDGEEWAKRLLGGAE